MSEGTTEGGRHEGDALLISLVALLLALAYATSGAAKVLTNLAAATLAFVWLREQFSLRREVAEENFTSDDFKASHDLSSLKGKEGVLAETKLSNVEVVVGVIPESKSRNLRVSQGAVKRMSPMEKQGGEEMMEQTGMLREEAEGTRAQGMVSSMKEANGANVEALVADQPQGEDGEQLPAEFHLAIERTEEKQDVLDEPAHTTVSSATTTALDGDTTGPDSPPSPRMPSTRTLSADETHTRRSTSSAVAAALVFKWAQLHRRCNSTARRAALQTRWSQLREFFSTSFVGSVLPKKWSQLRKSCSPSAIRAVLPENWSQIRNGASFSAISPERWSQLRKSCSPSAIRAFLLEKWAQQLTYCAAHRRLLFALALILLIMAIEINFHMSHAIIAAASQSCALTVALVSHAWGDAIAAASQSLRFAAASASRSCELAAAAALAACNYLTAFMARICRDMAASTVAQLDAGSRLFQYSTSPAWNLWQKVSAAITQPLLRATVNLASTFKLTGDMLVLVARTLVTFVTTTALRLVTCMLAMFSSLLPGSSAFVWQTFCNGRSIADQAMMMASAETLGVLERGATSVIFLLKQLTSNCAQTLQLFALSALSPPTQLMFLIKQVIAVLLAHLPHIYFRIRMIPVC